MHPDRVINEIVVFRVRLAGETIAVAGRRNDDLDLTVSVENSAGEELINTVGSEVTPTLTCIHRRRILTQEPPPSAYPSFSCPNCGWPSTGPSATLAMILTNRRSSKVI